MVKKLRVAVALQPVATALFANSPFVDGQESGYLSFRSHIWLNTDNARTGMLPFAFEEGFGFEQYADYALDVPMYFVIRNGEYVNCAGENFRDFLAGKLPQLPGEKPTIKDWEDHLSTIFPRSASSSSSKCAAPTWATKNPSPPYPPFGRASSTTTSPSKPPMK